MLDLYNTQAANDGVIKSPNPNKVSTVRSFPDKDRKHHFHFYFNITDSMPSTESVVEAEFHLYKMKPKETVKGKSDDIKSHLLPKIVPTFQEGTQKWHLRVYQVMQTSNMNEENNRLLDIRSVSIHSVGWEVFYVKPAIMDWLNDPQKNLDFKGYDFPEMPKHNPSPSNYQDLVPSLDHSMHPQESENSIARVRRSTEYQEDLLNETSPVTNQSLDCNRFEMYVNFEQIGWSDWIIFPKGYSAFYCKGGCNFPIRQNEYSSNHAAVQSIVNTLKLVEGVPKPSCVPNKLSPFLLLYRDDGGNFVLKQYANMVADSCSCQ
ncbi:LOW QUALITY PROTEIN: bone morphogenetic protein 4-like [Limulus polyphemus]|uniref:LOW QUALITY PROTEIN: bone morphogenetic protein 4-like n=1 Tax=Limulus polyphemus TaxID=6850 RepID=A0ABM1S192_LIMPO|nr:LOW QUALITY PROTEIN: bone morphogenetic protein 4-like [Limulus polyphemus]